MEIVLSELVTDHRQTENSSKINREHETDCGAQTADKNRKLTIQNHQEKVNYRHQKYKLDFRQKWNIIKKFDEAFTELNMKCELADKKLKPVLKNTRRYLTSRGLSLEDIGWYSD